MEDETMIYHIRVQGHLSQTWTDWLGSTTLTLEDNGNTILSCTVADQAALYGVLKKVRDVGLTAHLGQSPGSRSQYQPIARNIFHKTKRRQI
jgi:hypothetical protein